MEDIIMTRSEMINKYMVTRERKMPSNLSFCMHQYELLDFNRGFYDWYIENEIESPEELEVIRETFGKSNLYQ